MNRELKLAIEQVGREKGIATEVLFEALESALLSASKRTMGVGDNTRLTLDRDTGAIRVFAEKRVVEKVADPKLEMSLDEARRLKPGAQLEDVVEVDLEMKELGRIAAQTAKQVILQRVREAERAGNLLGVQGPRGDPGAGPGPPDREAHGHPGHGPDRGRAARAGADPGRAVHGRRSRARVHHGGPEHAQGPAGRALARASGVPDPALRDRDPGDRRGHRPGARRRAGARGAGQAGGGVHQAGHRSDRRLRGPPRDADPGHRQGAARREDRHHRVVGRPGHAGRACPVAGQGQLGHDHRRGRGAHGAGGRAGQPALARHRQEGAERSARREADRASASM